MGEFEDRLAKAFAKERWPAPRTPSDYPAPTIAQEAYELVYGDRQASYGHPASDFTAMGRITAAILSRWLESEGYAVIKRSQPSPAIDGPVRLPDIPPATVALVMTAVKLSRESAQHKRDNLVDLIGYVACKQRIEEGDERA